jgi:hypothetical protein
MAKHLAQLEMWMVPQAPPPVKEPDYLRLRGAALLQEQVIRHSLAPVRLPAAVVRNPIIPKRRYGLGLKAAFV